MSLLTFGKQEVFFRKTSSPSLNTPTLVSPLSFPPPPIHTFPTMHCNTYCSFAHAPKVYDVNSPPWGPVPVSLSKDKNCKSHSSPFRCPFLVHCTQAKNFSSKFIRHSSKIDKPFLIPNSPPLSFATSSPSPHTEVLFPPPSQYAALYPPYSATNQQFHDGHESLFPTRPPFPAPYETPPPAHSFYPSCLPCQPDSGLRLFNCLIMNPNCSPCASSISLPIPPPIPKTNPFLTLIIHLSMLTLIVIP